MGANESSQQAPVFTALGPIAIENYQQFIPKKKIREGETQENKVSENIQEKTTQQQQVPANNGPAFNPQQIQEIQDKKNLQQETKQAEKIIPQQPNNTLKQGDQAKPIVNNQPVQKAPVQQVQEINQQQIKPPQQNQQNELKQPNPQQQQQVQQQKEESKSNIQTSKQQIEENTKPKDFKQNNQPQQPNEPKKQPEKNNRTIRQTQYKRKANWNMIQNWDNIGSYLNSKDIVKLVALSKPVHKQIMQGVSFKVAQSNYLEGTEYIVVEEEEGEEEEIEEYQDGLEDRTFSPTVEEQLRIEQSSSPGLQVSANDPIRNSAVNKPMTTSFHEKKNESLFKKAQTLKGLTSIQETLRETSEVDSLDKKDRACAQKWDDSIQKQMNDSSPNPNKELEEVMETESRSIYTETEGQSMLDNQDKNQKIKDTKKQEIMNGGEYGQYENHYQQKQVKDDTTSNAASNVFQMMKTLPSNAENPMQSLKFNEELIYEKIHHKDSKGDHQGTGLARSTSDYQWDKNDSHLKPIESKAHSSMHLNPGISDEKDIFQKTGIKKQISEVQGTRQQQMKTFIPNIKHLNAPPKMQLKETLQYNAELSTPMIRIFEEEIEKQSLSLQNSIKEQNSGQSINSLSNVTAPKAELSITSPKVGNQGSAQRNISQYPGGKNINQIEASVETEQSAKEKAYLQFKEIYEKRLLQQKEQSQEAQQKAKKAIEFQKPFTTQRNNKSKSSAIEHSQTVGNLPLIPNQLDEEKIDVDHATSLPDIKKPHQTPHKNKVHFEDQLKELKDDMQKYRMEESIRTRITFQESQVTEDPSGAYTQISDVKEMKDLATLRELALSSIPYRKSRSSEKLSLLRIEMRKKMLVERSMREQYEQQQAAQRALNQSMFERSHNSIMDTSINQRDTSTQEGSPSFFRSFLSEVPVNTAQKQGNSGIRMTFNNQSRNFNKMSEIQTMPNQLVPKSAMLESLNKSIFASAYQNPQVFKNLLMKFLCDGSVQEVAQLFQGAPQDDLKFRDSELFYFAMFHQQVDHNKETKLISPIAVAVNVGDPQLITLLLKNLKNVNIEFGIERRRKSSTVLKINQTSSVRKTSPLQFACSLGLHRIVEILLLNGANPDNVPLNDRLPNIDYHINPLVICMNPKYHDKDLEIEGLVYKRKFNPYSKEDVNHDACMLALLRYRADPNAELFGRRRKPRPIFHAVVQPYQVLKRLLDNVADRPRVVNQINAYQETPLCLISGEQGQADNDLKVKLLLDCGASCFASDLNPLNIAIKAKNYKIMRLLYRQGDASPNRNIADEKSPLEMAIIQNDSNLVRELLHWKELQNSLGEFFTSKDDKGRNIMHIIAEQKGVEVFRSLVSETNHKFLKQMKQALNQTSDPNQEWLTPLAFCYPNLELAKLFVRYGAEGRHLSFIHQFFAQAKFDENVPENNNQGIDRPYFNYLVKELQVNVNEIDAHGKDAVAYCYEANRKDYISFLVTGLGASMDQQTMTQGRTILLDAAMRGHIDLFEFLLMKGANPMARDHIGKTALEYIKNDYATVTSAPKTAQIKDRMSQILYKYHLSKPFKSMAPPIQKQTYPMIQPVPSYRY